LLKSNSLDQPAQIANDYTVQLLLINNTNFFLFLEKRKLKAKILVFFIANEKTTQFIVKYELIQFIWC